MNKRNIGRIMIFYAFIIIICCSNGIWFFAKKYFDSTNYENRQMSTRPLLTLESYETFANDYTAYFNDNIPFRNNLITMNSAIDYFCFGRSSSDKVIIGKDNWLFYSRIDDGDPISCYKGTNLYTEEELADIATNCVMQRDFVESLGKEFLIFIAPNKERIYSEYMPERYGNPADNYRVLQVYNYLKNNTDLRIIYPYDELMLAKETLNENIYFKSDTHWNYLGGYVGAVALMKDLGINMPEINSASITIKDEGETSGDLAGMLNLTRQLLFADHSYTVSGYDTHNSKLTEDESRNMLIYKADNADPRSIFIIRDSFTIHMADYIGSQFNNAYMSYIWSYSYDDFVNYNPDIVVFECVERNVDKLRSFCICQQPIY